MDGTGSATPGRPRENGAGPARSPGGRDENIDIARALAIFYIVAVWHGDDYFGNRWANPATAAVTAGALGFFFHASAALVSRGLVPPGTFRETAAFWRRRLRIYPEYLLALALFAAFGLLGAKSALCGAFCLNPLLGVPLRTLWFVATLLLYQAAVPFLLWKNGGTGRILFRGALILAVLAAVHRFSGTVDPRLIAYWPVFVAGLVLNRNASALRHPPLPAALPGLLCLVAEAAAGFRFPGPLQAVRETLCAFAGAALLPAAARFLRPPSLRRWLARCGSVSAGIYLWHRIAIALGLRLATPGNAALRYAWIVFCGLVVSAAFGMGVGRVRALLSRRPARAESTPGGPSGGGAL